MLIYVLFYDGLVGKGVWGLGVCVWVIGWAMGIRGEATSQVQKGSKNLWSPVWIIPQLPNLTSKFDKKVL